MRPQARPLSFADFELQAQGIALEATMQALADFLDAHEEELVTLVHADLVRGLRRPRTGRDGLSAPQVLRAFVLQRVKAWDLRELRERIADGYTLRRFTTFDAQPVPQHDAFNRAFLRLTPATVRALNDAVVQAAVTLGLEDGAQLRVDTTVVETDIHFPTDNTLLWDAVRVLTRLVQASRRARAERAERVRRPHPPGAAPHAGDQPPDAHAAPAPAAAQVPRSPRRHRGRRGDGARRRRHGPRGPAP